MASISVIVPVYKVEAYLDRCVESILRQSFRDLELILVDDGSPDNCGKMCDAWAKKDSRIRVIHQENGGLSAARNAGLDWLAANSNSSWVAFVDSDDWIHEDYLLHLYKAAAETGSRISACGVFRTTDEFPETPVSGRAEPMTADDYFAEIWAVDGSRAMACNKLYHRSLFRTLRFPLGKLHEDEFTTYLAIYESGRVGMVTDALYAYYQNPKSITLSRWNPRRLDVLEAFEMQMDYGMANGLDRLVQKAVAAYVYTIQDTLVRLESFPEYRKYRPVLRKKLRMGLKKAKPYRLFPFESQYLWAYESAWPCRILWWFVSKVR